MMLAAMLAAAFTLPAAADEKPANKAGKGDGAAQTQQLQQQLLARFDANKDGVLNDQEKLAANEFMRRNGVLGGVEPGGFPGADQFAKQFDKDGDGKLNDQEKLLAQAAWQRMRGKDRGPVYGPGYGGLPGNGGFAQANANAGGIAGANAAAAGGAGGEGKVKVSALVKRFDKDGDGKLNDEEKAAAQADLKKDKKEPKGKIEKPVKP